MPTTAQSKNGEHFIFENGKYRLADPKESDILNMSAFQAFKSSALNMLDAAGSSLAAGQLAQTPQGQQASGLMLDRSVAALERQGPISELRPGPAEFAGEALLGAIPLAGSAIRRRAQPWFFAKAIR